MILAFESGWMGQFWPPSAVLGDPEFNYSTFRNYLNVIDTKFKLIPLDSTTRMCLDHNMEKLEAYISSCAALAEICH